jgi:hypothetical protein
MLDDLTRAGVVAVFGMVVSLMPLVVAVTYMIRPNERLLGLMRPLSLATIFAALNTFLYGLTAVIRHIPMLQTAEGYNIARIAHGLSESVTPMFVAFGFLAVAWLFVAVGTARQP